MYELTIYFKDGEIYGCYDNWWNGNSNCAIKGKDGCHNCVRGENCQTKQLVLLARIKHNK
jgi:hypothetical protein